MACGGCTKRRDLVKAARSMLDTPPVNYRSLGVETAPIDVVMGGYKYLTDRQIKARLETYKRRYCNECKTRYDCTYETYVTCKGIKNNVTPSL